MGELRRLDWIREAVERRVPSTGALFVSDVHIGAAWGDPEREATLCDMLANLPDSIQDIVLGGDVFEFWYEWRHVEPRLGRRLLVVLEVLAHSRRVWMIRGNHDFAIGENLTARGFKVLEDGLCLEISGKRWLCLHGDGMAPSDWPDRLVRRVLRHPVSQWMYRHLLHPDWAVGIALRTGKTSRAANPGPAPNISQYLKESVRWMQAYGLDGVVHGHTHRPLLWQAEGRSYVNNGDWCQMKSRVLIGPLGPELEILP